MSDKMSTKWPDAIDVRIRIIKWIVHDRADYMPIVFDVNLKSSYDKILVVIINQVMIRS